MLYVNLTDGRLNKTSVRISSKEAQLSHSGAQNFSEKAQLSKDSSRFSSYEAYVLPNYGVSAGVRVVYNTSSNQEYQRNSLYIST